MHCSSVRCAIFAVHVLLLSSSALFAEETNCAGVDPDGGPLGYKQLLDDARCEGLYRSPIAGASLELLSLTSGAINFKVRSNSAVRIVSPDIGPLKADKLTVRARALPLGTYYRMDTTIVSGAAFKWPTSILEKTKLSSDMIGAVGWVNLKSTKIYVPISITEQNVIVTAGASVVAILRSSADIEQVFSRMRPIDKNKAATPWESTKAMYRAGQPIRLELRVTKGITEVEIAAKTVGSDEWTKLLAQVYTP